MGATDPGGGTRDRGVGKPEGPGVGPSGLRQGGPGVSIVKVRFEPSGKVADVAPGTALLTAAHWARVPVASSCGGVGSCGECRVRLPSGGSPEGADGEFLSRQDIDDGWRLACRVEVREELTCSVPPTQPQPHAVIEGVRRRVVVEPRVRLVEADGGWELRAGAHLLERLAGKSPPELLGLAVDLGTTTVAGALVRLADGVTLASGSEINRQLPAGTDVISRAAFAHERSGGAEELQAMALETLNTLVEGLCREAGVERGRIAEMVVAGNATMLHLLVGEDPYSLAVAPFRTVFSESLDVTLPGLEIHPRGRVVTFPVIGAYAGGDTVAGIQATDLLRGERPRLLIDIGTNTEVALGWEGKVVVASAPAGPAFEGGRVGAGMPAVAGAVARVRLEEALEVEVIGGEAPRGICGTGLVELLAELRRTGLVDARGRLASAFEMAEHPLSSHLEMLGVTRAFRVAEGVVLSQRDVRELQSAVAAVRAAVTIVLEHGGVEPQELEGVYLAGSFGSALTPESAQGVGLVPRVDADVVQGVGNAAMEGARAALVSFRERGAAFQIPVHATYVELSGHDRFNDLFLEGMAFPKAEG